MRDMVVERRGARWRTHRVPLLVSRFSRNENGTLATGFGSWSNLGVSRTNQRAKIRHHHIINFTSLRANAHILRLPFEL